VDSSGNLLSGERCARAVARSISRRRFLAAASLLLAAPAARAQAPARLPRMGLLSPHRTPSAKEIADSPIRNRLRELGWIDGQTFVIVPAFGEGSEARLDALAADLVRKQVDVIWALGPEAAVAAARATKSIPIVFWGVAYPIEQGLVDSLARPGRNATGVA
jgi:putative ABC transport system substrate-binding protein